MNLYLIIIKNINCLLWHCAESHSHPVAIRMTEHEKGRPHHRPFWISTQEHHKMKSTPRQTNNPNLWMHELQEQMPTSYVTIKKRTHSEIKTRHDLACAVPHQNRLGGYAKRLGKNLTNANGRKANDPWSRALLKIGHGADADDEPNGKTETNHTNCA